jgi:pimeloyl-ACP methyl ester carboxylesterase
LSTDDIVLIGHSAGGGLAQYFLSRGVGRVGGLVVMAAFPPFGGCVVLVPLRGCALTMNRFGIYKK